MFNVDAQPFIPKARPSPALPATAAQQGTNVSPLVSASKGSASPLALKPVAGTPPSAPTVHRGGPPFAMSAAAQVSPTIPPMVSHAGGPTMADRLRQKRRYTAPQLLQIKERVGHALLATALDEAATVVLPPYHRVPRSMVRLLQLPYHSDFVDMASPLLAAAREITARKGGAAAGHNPESSAPYDAESHYRQAHHTQRAATPKESGSPVEGLVPRTPPIHPADKLEHYHCLECASLNCGCCIDIAAVVKAAKARVAASGGAFLLQKGDVVLGSVALLLVFNHKRTEVKLRTMADRHPKIVALIKEFLCGEGFHVPPPAVTDHNSWHRLMEILRFDWLRDNRTKVFTELSKYWRKSHSQFEQFVHFLFYRDDSPFHQTRGMLTHAQKPVCIACIAGDIDATVVLCELGFFVLPDWYWDLLPYFKETLQPREFNVLRHLCVYYYKKRSTTAPQTPVVLPSHGAGLLPPPGPQPHHPGAFLPPSVLGPTPPLPQGGGPFGTSFGH